MMQLSLFTRPAPPPPREDGWTRAMKEPVQSEIVEVLNSHIGQWLGLEDFRAIQQRHDIGFGMGHALAKLEREGRATSRRVYYGTEEPGPGYKGHNCLYASIEAGPAVDHTARRWP